MTFDPRYYMEPHDEFSSKSANEADKFIESLDATSALNLAKRAIASDEEKQAADEFQSLTVPAFMKANPAYIDSDRNMKIMQHEWRSLFNVEVPTFDQLEQTYASLRTSGVLTLKKSEVEKEDAAKIAEHLDAINAKRKASEFDEASAWEMPLEQLRLKANGVL